MKRLPSRFRSPLTFLAAVLFLAFTLRIHSLRYRAHRSLSDAAAPPRRRTSSASSSPAPAASDGQFHAFRSGDLEAAAANPAPEPRQLSLLDPGADPESRRRFLHRMPFGTDIVLAAERHQVDGLLLAAIIAVESGFSAPAPSPPRARSA